MFSDMFSNKKMDVHKLSSVIAEQEGSESSAIEDHENRTIKNCMEMDSFNNMAKMHQFRSWG